jgi:hypothetical protein
VVRDITDILHPANVIASEKLTSPQFISATEVSFFDTQLFRMRLGEPRRALDKGGWPFAWSPDGMSVAYVTGTPGTGVADVYIESGTQSRRVDTVPALKGGIGCESRACGDAWDVRMLYSQNGAYVSLNFVPGVGVLRIWAADGRVLKSLDSSSATMSVWSGGSFYWRDDKGVEMWRDGIESLVLPGVGWIRPKGSPGGGQIVYETRDGSGVAHVHLLDTRTNRSHELVKSRSEPAFLNAHLIWYQEERVCGANDQCPPGQGTTTSGKTYIYDLQDQVETESVIAAVFDVWPHAA